jgi:abortive infection bacteriophage resistance protein
MDRERFCHSFKHEDFIAELKRELKLNSEGQLHKSKDVFLRHYYEKYSEPELPPSWMLSEILTFGKWSIIYKYIRPNEDRAAIANKFNLHYQIFGSWLHSITYLRNLCAHHSRLWNRWFAITPKIIDAHRTHLEPNHTFYAQAALLHILMRTISPDSRWPMKLHVLMEKHPSIPISKMGFKDKWEADPFWL